MSQIDYVNPKTFHFQDKYFLVAIWDIMVTDSSAQSQPVHVKDIEHHSELGRAFSSITYRKVIDLKL